MTKGPHCGVRTVPAASPEKLIKRSIRSAFNPAIHARRTEKPCNLAGFSSSAFLQSPIGQFGVPLITAHNPWGMQCTQFTSAVIAVEHYDGALGSPFLPWAQWLCHVILLTPKIYPRWKRPTQLQSPWDTMKSLARPTEFQKGGRRPLINSAETASSLVPPINVPPTDHAFYFPGKLLH